MAAFDQHRSGFWHWLNHVKIYRLVILLIIILITVPLVAHYYISKLADELAGDGMTSAGHHSRTKLDHADEISTKASDLRAHIEELKKIKASVNNELRELESKRQKIMADISGYTGHIDALKATYESTNVELRKLKISIESTRLEQEELSLRNMPDVRAPYRILPSPRHNEYTPPLHSAATCRMFNCFDYSRCSVSSQFPVYIYNTEEHNFVDAPLDVFVKHSVSEALDASHYLTHDPTIACIFIVVVGDVEGGLQNVTSLQDKLQRLPYWNGDGTNHILLNLARSMANRDVFAGVHTGRAIVAQSTFTESQFRSDFDIILPPALGVSQGDVWQDLPPIVPARRKFLLSFQGEYRLVTHLTQFSPTSNTHNKVDLPSKGSNSERAKDNTSALHPPKSQHGAIRSLLGFGDTNEGTRTMVDLMELERTIVETLERMQSQYPSDGFLFEFSCKQTVPGSLHGEWALCASPEHRQDLLQHSTFSLILAPSNFSVISTTLTQVRIFEALRNGAIPVVLGDYVSFPWHHELSQSWKKSTITLPKQLITQLHFYIRSISDSDILEYRQQGRLLYETYLGNTQSIMNTFLMVVRRRLHIPAFPVKEEPTPSVFNATYKPLKEAVADPEPDAETDILGPPDSPFPSIRYQRNFTQTSDPFTVSGDPFHLYPFSPFDPVMPGEAKFVGSGVGFRPIGRGMGGAGKEFSESLGGNVPREQFTIVMLTYEREAVLVSSLARLKGLPHLNKILVVWNNPALPHTDLIWPDIGVEIIVVKTARNSLNNRFLPYDAIETEAILSLDDDTHLRHDEIMFGFRVWREARDRIVGFPGRFHAWDMNSQSWLYNSNYSCELSMVITGAAFFHKHYTYIYSYIMPQAIRDKVDEYLNCEDLAMNFLVSHITRKPPVKVTSRWTFRCPGCPTALSEDDSHFQERHKCINFFVQVYGYMPLLHTQYRVDSVLFKTRIPHNKQKCFKFI